MALIKQFFADWRGKLAGTVFSANKGGAYTREKVTPMNPQTEAQVNTRAILSSISSAYATLTNVQREGWAHLANTQPYVNIFGDSKKMTALAMFVKVNYWLAFTNNAQLTDAPQNLAVRGIGPITLQQISPAPRTFNLSYGPVNTATESIIITTAVSIPMSQMFVKNRYRFCQVAAGLAPDPIAVTSPVGLGPFTLGTNLWVRAFRLDNLNGGVSLAREVHAEIE